MHNHKIKKYTKWKPKYNLDKGLRIFIDWLKKDENLKKYKPKKYNIWKWKKKYCVQFVLEKGPKD